MTIIGLLAKASLLLFIEGLALQVKSKNVKDDLLNHGYKPKSKLWKRFSARYWVLYPPLCGIVRPANFSALRF
jgi:hypothetical protein